MPHSIAPNEQDLQSLLVRCKQKDRDAWNQIIRLHQPHIALLVHRLLAKPGDVDDVVQDVFVLAVERIHQFRGDAAFNTWLTRLAINACRSHRRKQWVRFHWLKKEKEKQKSHLAPPSHPAQKSLQQEQSQLIQQAINRLSARDRELIVLHYLEEMPLPELAAATGISANTLYVRLHRAREKLMHLLPQSLTDSAP